MKTTQTLQATVYHADRTSDSAEERGFFFWWGGIGNKEKPTTGPDVYIIRGAYKTNPYSLIICRRS